MSSNEDREYIGNQEQLPDGTGTKRDLRYCFAGIILVIMAVSLAVHPFSVVCFEAVEYLRFMKDAWWGLSWNVVAIVPVICFAVGCIVICSGVHEAKKSTVFRDAIGLYSVSFTIRLIAVAVLQSKPISDFERCYQFALTGTPDEYLAQYPYLGMYARTLKRFFELFPELTKGDSVFASQLLNCIATALIPVFIYLIILRLTGKGSCARLGGLTYAVFPSLIVYTAIPTCETFSQLFLIMAIYFWVEARQARMNSGREWLFYVMTGVSIGMTSSYKKLFILIAPALLMAYFCYELLPMLLTDKAERTKKAKYVLIVGAKTVLMLVIGFAICKTMVSKTQTEVYGGPISGNSSPAFAVIYEGLCKEGGGTWNMDVKNYVHNVGANAGSAQEANKILFDALVEDYKNDLPALLKLIYSKTKIDWLGEDSYYYFTFSGERTLVQGELVGEILFAVLPKLFFAFVSVVIAVGIVPLVISKEYDQKKKHMLFVMIGIVYLFMLMLILIEAQGRYKSSIMPILCVVYVLCFEQIGTSVKQLLQKIKKGK